MMSDWLRRLDSILSTMSSSSHGRRRFKQSLQAARPAEIDVLEARLLLTSDFGDAPDPLPGAGRGNYQTLAVRGGPAHVIDNSQTNLYLGGGVDGESVAIPLSAANGDDKFLAGGRDDEDGVLSVLDLQSTVGASPKITLMATNTTTADATLYGWIDFNQNGIFENASERALIPVPTGTSAGRFTLTFPTSPAGSAGATYARFRLSSDVAAANALGTAQGGEVEDYPFTIQNRVSLPPVFTSTVEIGEGLDRGTENSSASLLGVDVAAIGDLNNDGVGDFAVTDVLNGVDFAENGLRGAVHIVFQNADGSVKSTTKIASGVSGGPTLEINDQFGASVTSLGDIDGDGIVDIAVGASGNGFDVEESEQSAGAVYILNLNTDGSVKRFTKIASGLNGGPELSPADEFGTALASIGDLDGDGLAELAVGAPGSEGGGVDRGAIHILYLNANGTVRRSTRIDNSETWSSAALDNSSFGARFAAIGDLDGNGIVDITTLVGRDSGDSEDSEDSSVPAAIYTLLLNPDGTVKREFTTIDGMQGGPALGNANVLWDVTAVGDIDADGVRDLAVVGEALLENTDTRIFLVTMNPDGSMKGYQSESISVTGPGLIYSLNALEDTNADGRMELAFGVPVKGGIFEPRGIVQVLTLEKAAVHTAAPTTPSIDRALSVSRIRRPTIQWSASATATSYEIWIKDAETGTVLVNSMSVNTNSYTPSVDLPMHRLQITVRAKNEIGKSPWAPTYNLSIARVVTTNPVATGMSRRPQLTWQPLPEAVRYEVWINAAATPRAAALRTTTADAATSFTPPTNLRSGVYQFQIRGIRANGSPDMWSDARTFEIKTKVESIGVREQFTLTPRLSWSQLNGASHYEIWVAGRPGTSITPLRLSTTDNATSLSLPSLPRGAYVVWVRGVALDGTAGEWSLPWDFMTGTKPTFRLSDSDVAKGSYFSVNWSLNEIPHHYEVWIDDPSPGLTPASSLQTVYSNTLSDVLANMHGKYRIWVRAVTANGTKSDWSSAWTISSRDKIENVYTTPGSLFRPEIRWSEMPGAVRYEVTIDSTAYLMGNTLRFVPPENLSVGAHSISVRAISADGTASRRSELLPYQVFRPPILHPVQSTPDPGVTLTWDDESSSPLTRIRVISLATNLPVLDTNRIDGSESLVAQLADGRYRWMVFSQGAEAWSNPAEFTIDRSSTMTSSLTQSTGAPVELTWLAVSGANRYDVWIMDDQGVTTYRNYSVAGTTFTVPVQLAAGQTYRTWVRAISSSGSAGSWSTVRLLTVTDVS